MVGWQPNLLQHSYEIHLPSILPHTHTETYPVSMALGIALVSSEERCIAALSFKANLLREGGA